MGGYMPVVCANCYKRTHYPQSAHQLESAPNAFICCKCLKHETPCDAYLKTIVGPDTRKLHRTQRNNLVFKPEDRFFT